MCFQALSGFLFVVTCEGEVFYASHTVEQYLGFHQVSYAAYDNLINQFNNENILTSFGYHWLANKVDHMLISVYSL